MDTKNCMTSARCLFPSQMTGFSVGDIIKSDSANAEDFSSDDSGTDALYIAEDESHEQSSSTPESDDSACRLEYRCDSAIDAHEKIQPELSVREAPLPTQGKAKPHAEPPSKMAPIHIPVACKTPLISDYPPPSMGSYPMTAFNPMFLPSMFSSPHPGLFNHQPFYPYMAHQIPPQPPVMSQSLLSRSDNESGYRVGPPSDGRSSPTDSVASSANSSTRSPSPRMSSPQEPDGSPRPPTPTRTKTTTNGRTCYSHRQIRIMEKLFAENRYPDYEILEKTSADLGIPVKKIKVWFQNKRARSKSRASDMSPHTMAAMMSSAAAFGYMGHGPMMQLPYPMSTSSLVYPGYPYPAMYSSPMC